MTMKGMGTINEVKLKGLPMTASLMTHRLLLMSQASKDCLEW